MLRASCSDWDQASVCERVVVQRQTCCWRTKGVVGDEDASLPQWVVEDKQRRGELHEQTSLWSHPFGSTAKGPQWRSYDIAELC